MTNSSADWISVRYSDVRQSKDGQHQGVTIRLMTTPQDVPEMWRHGVVTKPDGSKEVVFEFKYLASPEPARTFSTNGVRFVVAKNSRRVYSMSFPLPSTGIESGDTKNIEVQIEMAIEQLEQEGRLRESHAGVIQAMLRKFQNQEQQKFAF